MPYGKTGPPMEFNRMTPSFQRAQHIKTLLQEHPKLISSIAGYALDLPLKGVLFYVLCPLMGLAVLAANMVSYAIPEDDGSLFFFFITLFVLALIWPLLSCPLILRHYGVVSSKSLTSAGLSLPEGFLCDRHGNFGEVEIAMHTKLNVLHHFEHLPSHVQAMLVKRQIVYYVQ